MYEDDAFDECECGGNDFEANEREWERVCLNCGLTSAYELFNYVPVPIPYYYKHENYFQNTIMNNAIKKGAPISHLQEQLLQMFRKSVDNFHRVKRKVDRMNYPNYQYALLKLCEHLHVDVHAYVSLPKMKKTMVGVIRDWEEIDPTKNF